MAIPDALSSLTVPPSVMLPAAVGCSPSIIVRSSESVTVSVPSDTVRVSVMTVSESTWGAVNVVEGEAASAKSIAGEAGLCVHSYVRGSPPGSLTVPDRVTTTLSPTVWSGPASTVRRMLMG